MKRYTHLPQVVLGAAFGWSIPMAFSAVSESLPRRRFNADLDVVIAIHHRILGIVGHRPQNVGEEHQPAAQILFGENDRLIIGILQVAVLALMGAVGWLNGLGWERSCCS
jgi:4-hydroxybenzoate polyprenyltransferase